MIFSRRRGSQRRNQDEQPQPVTGDAAPAELAADEPPAGSSEGDGPHDSSQASEDDQAVDLGALRIPMVEGVELRVQADPEGRIQHVILVAGESALQLAVFAAPKTEPVWDEALEMLRGQLRSDGFTSREVEGEYGRELRARVRTPEGMADIRFVGFNGPRWLVRGVFQGAAATDPAAEGPLRECLRRLVVHRGNEAMPVHDALPLRLPKEAIDRAQGSAETGGTAGTATNTLDRAVSRPDGRQKPRRR